MPFCPKCGTSSEGRFCASCGARIETAGPPPSGELAPNFASAFCYLLLVLAGVIFLLIDPYRRDRTVRFHAFQSLMLAGAWVLVLALVQFLGAGALFLAPVLNLGFLALWMYLILKTYQGVKIVLPIIGPAAEKQVS